jgi:hypothetical protein
MKIPLLLCTLALLSSQAWADLTIKPGTKPKETAKDIKKAQEERMKDGFTTPECLDKTGQFVTGQSVLIELEAATASTEQVKFVVREQPKHGILSALRPHPNPQKGNKSIITYTHTGSVEDLADSFTYVAKLSEGPSSNPATVTLSGKAAAPKLEILQHPLFKPLQAGGEDLGEFVVKNSGSAVYNGDLTWPAPFIGPPKIVLLVGESQTYLIKAKPPAPGGYRLDLPLQPGNEKATLRSVLECVQPFSVVPSVLELNFDRATGLRKGTVKVTNISSAPLKLTIDAHHRISAPTELLVEPGATTDFTLGMKPEDVEAFRGEVWFLRDPSKEKLIISAPAEPAQLALVNTAQQELNFGSIERGRDATVKVSFKNGGGQVAAISPLNLPPFFIATPTAELIVPPGGSKEVVFAFKPDMPGKYEKSLTLSSTGGDLTFKATATMVDPRRGPGNGVNPATGIQNPHTPAGKSSPPPRATSARSSSAESPSAPPVPSLPATPARDTEPSPSSSSAGGAATANASAESSGRPTGAKAALLGMVQQFGVGLDSLPQFQSPTVDPMQAVRAFDLGPDFVVVGWLLPEQNPPASVRLECAKTTYNAELRAPLKTWEEVKTWQPASAPEGAGAARISGLQPNRQYEFRVLGVDSQGLLSKGSDLLTIQTPDAPFFTSRLIVGSLVTLLLAYAAWSFFRQRKQLGGLSSRHSHA